MNNSPFFKTQNDYVTVWIGNLNLDELEDYLEESENPDDEFLSKFGSDLGKWYDHDFIFCEATDEPVSLVDLCQLNDIESQELIDEIILRSKNRKAKSLLLLWNSKEITKEQRVFADGRLICLGSWQHESPIKDPEW